VTKNFLPGRAALPVMARYAFLTGQVQPHPRQGGL